MAFETFYRYNNFAKRLYAQFNLIRSLVIRLSDSCGHQQASGAQIFNFVGGREIAAMLSQPPDDAE
jgi:hypothetical protein